MIIKTADIKITGHLQDRVYYYLDHVLTSRSFFIPVQPGTPAQLARWEIFSEGVLTFQNLSETEKKSWNQSAVRFQVSGFNFFMSKYLKTH